MKKLILTAALMFITSYGMAQESSGISLVSGLPPETPLVIEGIQPPVSGDIDLQEKPVIWGEDFNLFSLDHISKVYFVEGNVYSPTQGGSFEGGIIKYFIFGQNTTERDAIVAEHQVIPYPTMREGGIDQEWSVQIFPSGFKLNNRYWDGSGILLYSVPTESYQASVSHVLTKEEFDQAKAVFEEWNKDSGLFDLVVAAESAGGTRFETLYRRPDWQSIQ